MNSIIPLIKELERIYDLLAKDFSLKYERPIITVQTKGRSKSMLGWFSKERWQYNKKEIGEINLCAEELKKDPIETLIHEMTHYVNSQEKIEDCNNAGYHNKTFKTKAESYGLNVEKNGRHGWGLTSLSDNLKEKLKLYNIDYKLFELYRKESVHFTLPTKMKKWSCGCTTTRCAVDLKAKCLKCNNEFFLKEQE
jgi:hypothetical protein